MQFMYNGHTFTAYTDEFGSYLDHNCLIDWACNVTDVYYGFDELWKAVSTYNRDGGYGDLTLGEFLIKMGYGEPFVFKRTIR